MTQATAIQQSTARTTEWLDTLTTHNVLRWQHGANNVGLLLAPLLEVSGWQGDILSLVDALPVTASQVTVMDILSVMAALGFRVHEEKCFTKDLRAEHMPALFVPDESKGWQAACVLREMGAYGLIWDNGREQHRGNLPEAHGTLYRFERTVERNDDSETPRPRTQWLSTLIGRFRPIFWQIGGLSFLLYFFALAMPLFSMAVYDRVITAHAPDTLPLLACGVIGALTLELAIRWLRVRLSGWVAARSSLLVTEAMFERLLFLPAAVIEQASVSAQLARIRAFESIRDFVASPMFLAWFETPFVLALMIVIGMLAGPAVAVLIGTVIFYGLLLFAMRPRWKRLGDEMAHYGARRQQMLMEILENRLAIFAAGITERVSERFRHTSWKAAQTQQVYSATTAMVQFIAMFLGIVAGITMIHWCLARIWAGDMTGGAMVATMILSWRVLYPLQNLCGAMPYIEQISASVRQVGQLMQLQPESHAERHVLAERQLSGNISFQNVSLRYSRKSDPVFFGLNADIKKGQAIAIFGGNGSGKSSILKLLLGLYLPATGIIRLDGVDHRQFDPRALRRQIAYLPQTPELLPGTVAENLRVVDPMAPEHRLRQALLWADVWEMIEELPAGMNTYLGEGGIVPSSGLAARLCLARLYLSPRPIVLCDELPATIMNSTTGERFRRFIRESKGQRTVIFVTHRDDWLALADQVVVIRPNNTPIVGKPGPKLYEKLEKEMV